ncbi:MAG: NAD-dependent epimerase/dehydratase family protein, partial [Chloroflexota bacterium]|nr:NAD-dependent epimerase/dehydratase family protein [Chloroflexota bacterium]
MATDRKRVVLTGATGYIAGLMLPELRERYDLTLIDVRDENRDGTKIPGVQILDVLTADRAELERLFNGADAIIHIGYIRP